jgi:hypothetical protein
MWAESSSVLAQVEAGNAAGGGLATMNVTNGREKSLVR